MSINSDKDDVTFLLNQISESIKEVNSVSYDILRIINDDWSKLSEQDSQFLMASMKMTQRLWENEKLSDLQGKKYSGDVAESTRLLVELKNYILQLKLRRTYYELKESLGDKDPNTESYSIRKAKILANRKKLRGRRKKKKK